MEPPIHVLLHPDPGYTLSQVVDKVLELSRTLPESQSGFKVVGFYMSNRVVNVFPLDTADLIRERFYIS